jgi:2-desacetyl-2-hydroxyethyl bacteriochlorophyllide A dehydrogenase
VKADRLVFTAVGRCEVETFEIDEDLRASEVLVRNRIGLISPGTELAIFTGQHRGFDDPNHWANFPWWPGYCNVGEVVATGRSVLGLSVGDRVVHEGTHATFARQHAATVVKVPDGLDDARAVFFKLAGIAATPQMVSPVGFGERAAVIGLGMVGNLAAQLCAAAGAWSVVAVDPAPRRRAVAKACRVVPVAAVTDLADPVPYVIEAVGMGATVRDAIHATAPGGRTIILSSPREKVELDPYFDIHHPSKQVIGTHESARDRTQRRPHDAYLLDLLATGRLSVDPFVTHRVPFGSELQQAYEGLRDDPNAWMGVLIDY